jgi:glucosamine 6-phosphate synthetase-like amidotransferase/phosphosugar isomerase protein
MQNSAQKRIETEIKNRYIQYISTDKEIPQHIINNFNLEIELLNNKPINKVHIISKGKKICVTLENINKIKELQSFRHV